MNGDAKNPNEYRDILIDGQQQNAIYSGQKFKVIRFYLDAARSRYDAGQTDHTFGSGIKSFWVCDTNNNSFVAKIVPNHKADRVKGSGLPLKYNMNQKFSSPVNDACLEFEAQSGIWIDIAFSESEDIEIGSTAITLTGAVSISRGSSHVSVSGTASGTISQMIAADSTRKIVYISNKSGNSIWVGNDTAGELQSVSYQDICEEIPPGGLFSWENSAALYCKSTASSKYSKRTES